MTSVCPLTLILWDHSAIRRLVSNKKRRIQTLLSSRMGIYESRTNFRTGFKSHSTIFSLYYFSISLFLNLLLSSISKISFFLFWNSSISLPLRKVFHDRYIKTRTQLFASIIYQSKKKKGSHKLMGGRGLPKVKNRLRWQELREIKVERWKKPTFTNNSLPIP